MRHNVIEALTSAGQGAEIDADQDVSDLWANERRDTYLRELILAAVETRRPDVQRRFELELEAVNSPEYAEDRKAKRRKLFGERGIVGKRGVLFGERGIVW